MKFLFICGSLEPGKNGVGDYTRRLAGECIRMGHDAMILALDERIWIEDAVISSSDSSQKWSFQDDYGTAVPCMRWPAGKVGECGERRSHGLFVRNSRML